MKWLILPLKGSFYFQTKRTNRRTGVFLESPSIRLRRCFNYCYFNVSAPNSVLGFPSTTALSVSAVQSHCFVWYTTFANEIRVGVQFGHSVISNSMRPHGLHVALQASLSVTSSQSLLKLMSIELVMPSNHLILCHPLLLLPSIFPSIKSWWVVCNSWHLLLPRLLFHSKRIHNANSYKGCCYRDRLDFILKYAILKSFVRKSWQFNS